MSPAPTPAIVAQSAVRRLPRLALLLFCLAYVLPGFLGRAPWKGADLTAYGYMAELAGGHTSWLNPDILGLPPEVDALLPYWLGAWAMWAAPAGMAPDLAARLPFLAMLLLALAGTWYGVYYLARTPQAQPVAFAFGGEAQPADYARALADGGLLALIACLGLAQLAHENTPALLQLTCTAWTLCSVAAMPYRRIWPHLVLAASLLGLALSGAPSVAVLFGLTAMVVQAGRLFARSEPGTSGGVRTLALIGAGTVLVALVATLLDLWHWRIEPPRNWRDWKGMAHLFLWFAWPAWPLVLWTLWRWRKRLGQPHIALPALMALVACASTLGTHAADRALLLALPPMAVLAAFALPTLERSVAALVDWFTLLFFTGSAFIIWVVWLAMQTGIPRQPAANVARLVPGFEPGFGWLAFLLALLATLAWAWLVQWRVGRHRAAIWKSLVLPAAGTALSWLLLMTLWLPLLDYARSYAPMVRTITAQIGQPECVEVLGMGRSQLAALRHHGRLTLHNATMQARCSWLLVDADAAPALDRFANPAQWQLVGTVRRPSDDNEDIQMYRRRSP